MSNEREIFAQFLTEESGAVTVDWVALTAALLMIGMFVSFTVSSSVPTLANKMSSIVSNRTVVPD